MSTARTATVFWGVVLPDDYAPTADTSSRLEDVGCALLRVGWREPRVFAVAVVATTTEARDGAWFGPPAYVLPSRGDGFEYNSWRLCLDRGLRALGLDIDLLRDAAWHLALTEER